jgi:prepilin-type processing-associated H-X9-DG protein
MSRPDDDRQEQSRLQSGFRWGELLVLLLIGVIFIGMLLPMLGRSHIRSNRLACENNIRQIGLGLQSAHIAQGQLPPAFGTLNGRPNAGGKDGVGLYPATLFYHLLPHLEQPGTYLRLPPLFNYPAANQYVLAPNPPIVGQRAPDENSAMLRVPSYICPSDITGDASGVMRFALPPVTAPPTEWGENCYAANYLLFGLVTKAKLPEAVPDGLSTTIFFTEKAPICSDTASGRSGGNLWAAAPFFPSSPQAQFNYGGTFGYDPSDANPTKPYSVTLFQTTPAAGSCDPTLAQTPHSEGMNVAMGDGSARFITKSISPKTWSALVTPYPIEGISFPAGGARVSDTPGSDWAND